MPGRSARQGLASRSAQVAISLWPRNEQPAGGLERVGPLGILTLNRPDLLNAVDWGMMHTLIDGMNDLIDDAAIRAILVTGAGRAFCAGTDLREMREAHAASDTPRGGDTLRAYFNPLILRMTGAGKPIIAAVNGPAAGVGCAFALAADIVLAARSATFIQAFIRIGAVPDAGSSWLLPRLVGQARATAMMMLGNAVSAEHAMQWGIVHQLCEDEALAPTARELATQLANGPTLAYAGIKRLVAASAAGDLGQHLALEAIEQDAAFETLDHREGVTAYTERRPPQFHAR